MMMMIIKIYQQTQKIDIIYLRLAIILLLKYQKGVLLVYLEHQQEGILEGVTREEDTAEGFLDLIINQVAPNNPLESNIAAPIVNAIENKTWYGGDLVPIRLQDELPENQYDETTDAFSKWLGDKIKVSPKKINYVLDQYSGIVGDVLLPITTNKAEQNVLASKFTTNSISNNKNVGDFFDKSEELTKIANDSEASDEDILKSKYINKEVI